MEEDFSIQFSTLYLPMKYLAIISIHPVDTLLTNFNLKDFYYSST